MTPPIAALFVEEREGGAAPRRGWVHIESWAGHSRHEVEYVGETSERFRVRIVGEPWRLRRRRQFRTGDVVLVPKRAVEWAASTERDSRPLPTRPTEVG